MFGKVFFNKTFKSYIDVFGTLFRDIHIGQFDSDGNMVNKVKVPLVYVAKERWYTDLKQKLSNPAAQILPTMSYVKVGLPKRKDVNRTAQKSEKVMVENGIFAVENPQDWEMNIRLSILAGSQVEMDQILEQIMHYFDPSFTVKILLLPSTINYVHDCAIHLESMEETENNAIEGDDKRRRILCELQFRFLIKVFGPVYINAGNDLTKLPFDDYIATPKSLGEHANKVILDIHRGGNDGEVYTYKDLQDIARDNRLTVEMEDGQILEVSESFYDGYIRNVVPSPLDVPAGSFTSSSPSASASSSPSPSASISPSHSISPSASISRSVSPSASVSPSSSVSRSSSASASPSSSVSASPSRSLSPSSSASPSASKSASPSASISPSASKSPSPSKSPSLSPSASISPSASMSRSISPSASISPSSSVSPSPSP